MQIEFGKGCLPHREEGIQRKRTKLERLNLARAWRPQKGAGRPKEGPSAQVQKEPMRECNASGHTQREATTGTVSNGAGGRSKRGPWPDCMALGPVCAACPWYRLRAGTDTATRHVMPENAMRASLEDMQLPVCRWCLGTPCLCGGMPKAPAVGSHARCTGLACPIGTVLKVRLRPTVQGNDN